MYAKGVRNLKRISKLCINCKNDCKLDAYGELVACAKFQPLDSKKVEKKEVEASDERI